MRKSDLAMPGAVLFVLAGVVAWLVLGEGCSPQGEAPESPPVVAVEAAAPALQPPAPRPEAPTEPPRPAPTPEPMPAPRPDPPPPAPEAPPPPAPTVVEEGEVVEGRVTDTAGAPIAGAKVVATTLRALADRGAKPAARGAATTGADGAFRARLPKGTALVDVAAAATGFASASVERVRVGAPVEIRLEREGVLIGRVLDPDGRPIANAAVRLFRVLGHEHVDTAASTTSAEGEYRIGGFGTAPWKNPFKEPRSIVLDVRAAGFAASQEWGPFTTRAGATTLRDVVLRPARPLTVDVTDADSGKPIPGARVTVGFHATGLEVRGTAEEPSYVPHPAPYVDEGVSDDRGVCVLANAPARLTVFQRLLVRAWKAGFTAEVVVVTTRPLVHDERVEVRLWPSATVRGRVVDTTGAPVPGTTVTSDGLDKLWDISFAAPLGDRPWGGTYRTTGVPTDEDGRYVLPCVRASAAGTVNAYVWTMGRREPLPDGRIFPLPYWGAGGRPPGIELRLRAGEETSAPDIVVAEPVPSRSAAFVVVDEADRPVADARVESTYACGKAAWTDAEGRAVLRWSAKPAAGPEAEAEPVVCVTATGFANAAVRCRPDVRFPPETRIVLGRGVRLEGRVREPDGRPAAGWTVAAWRSTGDQVTYGGAQTASDGTFAIDGVPACAVDLEVTHIGGASDWDRQLQYKGAVAGGAPVDIVLKADTTPYGSVVVTTADARDGSPVVESYATIDCGPGRWPCVARDAPGIVKYDRVPVGTRKVRSNAKGWLPAETTVTVAEGETTEVRIALVAGTPAELRVVAPVSLRTGPGLGGVVPVTASRVDVAPGEEGAGYDASSYDVDATAAIVRFDALPPGTYRLRFATGESGQRSYVATKTLEVGPSGRATARAALQFVLGGTIAVAVDDPEVPRWPSKDAPPSKAAIEVLAVGGERVRVVQGVVGGTQIPVLPGGYVVRLLLPSGRVRESQVTVRAGETETVRFDKP